MPATAVDPEMAAESPKKPLVAPSAAVSSACWGPGRRVRSGDQPAGRAHTQVEPADGVLGDNGVRRGVGAAWRGICWRGATWLVRQSSRGAGFTGPSGTIMRETAAARLLTPSLR